MNWLVSFIVALLRAFLPGLIRSSKDTSDEADRNVELRDRLRERVRRTWGKRLLCLFLLVTLCMMLGCGTRTIYVPDGTPVRLRETVNGAKVWILDKEGHAVPGRMNLPEGWYVLPDEGEGD